MGPDSKNLADELNALQLDIQNLIKRIQSDDPYSYMAILSLGHLGMTKNEEIVQLLKGCLDDKREECQVCAAQVLLHWEMVEGLTMKIGEILDKGVNSNRENVRKVAVEALPLLAKLGDL